MDVVTQKIVQNNWTNTAISQLIIIIKLIHFSQSSSEVIIFPGNILLSS